MIDKLHKLLCLLEEKHLPKDKVITILGPTASGKTRLAVALADYIDAEIISADSRQVYRQMDIGTGKDLPSYGNIPYHLIDICNPGEKYHLGNFISDFHTSFTAIRQRDKHTILCGGTGLYLQSVLKDSRYALIPSVHGFKESLIDQPTAVLIKKLATYHIPKDFQIDISTKKRIARSIEILEFLKKTPDYSSGLRPIESIVFGLNPPIDERREQISKRLLQRIKEGLLKEVEMLLSTGTSHLDLQYYGLEYKYASLYLLGEIDYNYFVNKLETEIHRYAKRQMTYFRKMEKDGITIHWL